MRTLLLTSVIALVVIYTSSTSRAATLDFEDVVVPPGSNIRGADFVSRGFRFHFSESESHLVNADPLSAWSGSTALLFHSLGTNNVLTISPVGGGTFALRSARLAEGPTVASGNVGLNALTVTVTGHYPGGSTVTKIVALDGVNDGPVGGLMDFQAATFGPEWSELTRVDFDGNGGEDHRMSLDDIFVIQEPTWLLDFEDLAVPPGSNVRGGDFVSRNFSFRFSEGESHLVNADPLSAWSGSTALLFHSLANNNVVTISPVGGGTFALRQVWLAEGPTAASGNVGLNARTVTVTGHYSAGGTVSKVIGLDGINDGPVGGLLDFQTATFGSDWSALTSVDFDGNGGEDHRMSIDNISLTFSPLLPILQYKVESDMLVLTWSTNFTGFALQQNPDRHPAGWTTVTESVTVVGAENQVVISPLAGKKFFRLIRLCGVCGEP